MKRKRVNERGDLKGSINYEEIELSEEDGFTGFFCREEMFLTHSWPKQGLYVCEWGGM